jgi:DNA-binding CsgD family transcriptional regulator
VLVGKSQVIREEDVKSMLRLMSEIAQLPADPTLRTQHAVQGIGKIVRARATFSTRFRSQGPGHAVQPYMAMQCGWDQRELQAVIEMASEDPLHDFVNKDMHAGHTWPFLCVNRRLDAGRQRLRRDIAPRIREMVGGDLDAIVVCPAAALGHFAGVGIQRSNGDVPFTDRELQIVRLLWTELSFLHVQPIAAVEKKLWGTRLPPRLQQVLDRLLAGDSAKQVAAHLRLSPHTVSDYIKELYRRFGVASRGELLAEFIAPPAGRRMPDAEPRTQGPTMT